MESGVAVLKRDDFRKNIISGAKVLKALVWKKYKKPSFELLLIRLFFVSGIKIFWTSGGSSADSSSSPNCWQSWGKNVITKNFWKNNIRIWELINSYIFLFYLFQKNFRSAISGVVWWKIDSLENSIPRRIRDEYDFSNFSVRYVFNKCDLQRSMTCGSLSTHSPYLWIFRVPKSTAYRAITRPTEFAYKAHCWRGGLKPRRRIGLEEDFSSLHKIQSFEVLE